MFRNMLLLMCVTAVLLLAACPRPISDTKNGAPAALDGAGRDRTRVPGQPLEGKPGSLDPDNGSGGVDESEELMGGGALGPDPAGTGEVDVDEGGNVGQVTEPDGDEQPGQQPDEESSGEAATLDGTTSGSEPQVFAPAPPKVNVTSEMKRFAGNYAVISITQNGESSPADADRVMIFNIDGSYDGLDFRQPGGPFKAGIWSLADGVVTASFGPAGEERLDLAYSDENIAVFRSASGALSLFCARLPEDSTAASPAESYDTDFGELTVSRSGPGYWKGEYGDPPGSLVLQERDGFLYGTWEQGSQAGYIIFSLTRDGFEGYWWYAGQDSLSGHWNGTRSN